MMVVMMTLFMMVMRLFFLLFAYLLLYATNPSGGSCGTFKVKEVGMDNLIQVYICIIALYNLGTGLQGVDNLPDTFYSSGCTSAALFSRIILQNSIC